MEKGLEQFAWAMKTAGDEAETWHSRYSKHLPGTSTNTLTSFKEALKFVKNKSSERKNDGGLRACKDDERGYK